MTNRKGNMLVTRTDHRAPGITRCRRRLHGVVPFGSISPAFVSLVVVVFSSWASSAISAEASDKHVVLAPTPLSITPIDADAWRSAIPDVQKVLDSASASLWRHFPRRRLAEIQVSPRGGPIVIYRSDPLSPYRVRLSTGDNLWAQMSYQFAHELCHILANYQDDEHRNKWFEESLCELASIYTLRHMAKTWRTEAPYPNWKSYHESLTDYADNIIKKSSLDEGKTLAAWYQEHRDELSKKADRRELNSVVAVTLLPRFERRPEHWAAIEYLNTGKLHGSQSLQQFLAEWRSEAPRKHSRFIEAIAVDFGLTLADD